MIKLAVVHTVSTCGPLKVEVIEVEPDQWLPRSALPPTDCSRLGYLDGGSDNAIYVPIADSVTRTFPPYRTWIPESALTYLKPEEK